eukprot:TRINITY_DN1879_c0_g1_i1.p3 TRINITY_DN1879_c0_g1~~TRINITY_DN1879_c0_g1_i1.p3  ORF type:complete len:146 (+),score=30.72 TRINITY_DN1879_c0_g1_i1:1922-2359(+)
MMPRSLLVAAAFVVLGLVASSVCAQNNNGVNNAATGQQFQNQATGNIVFESFPLVKTLTCTTNRDCQSGEVCVSSRCSLLAGQLPLSSGGGGTGASASASIGGVGASASAGTNGVGAQIGSPAARTVPATVAIVGFGGALALLAL